MRDGGREEGGREKKKNRLQTYIAAKPRMVATSTFVFLCICKSLTMKIGMAPNTQSAAELSDDTTYVVYNTAFGLMHVPV